MDTLDASAPTVFGLIDVDMGIRDFICRWTRSLYRDGIALWFAVRDPATPLLPKLLCVIVVAYALSPIDLIPDFIPILGLVDDALLLPALIWLAIRIMPKDIMASSWHKADAWLQYGRAKLRSITGAVVVVLLWLAAAGLVWRWYTAAG